MNVIMIALATLNLAAAIGLIIKHRSYVAAFFFLFVSAYALSQTRMSEYVIHHQPMVALYKNDVLIVIDSNKTLYIDSTYIQGMICLDEDIHKNIYGYLSHEKLKLNTLCQ